MISSKFSTIEAIMLILTVYAAHSILSMPGTLINSTKSATIINLIYVSIIALLITLLIFKLLKGFPSSDIIDVSEYLGGKTFKTIIGLIFILYFIFSSAILIRNFCACLKIVHYPMTNIIFIILAFIVASCITLRLNFSTCSKVNVIVLPLVLLTVLFIFFANFKNFSIQNLFPILGDGIFNTFVSGLGNLGAFGGIAILYFIPPYLKEPDKFKQISFISTGIASIYILLCVSTVLFMFRYLMNVDEILPLYAAARYIEFGTFFQRLESGFLFVWIFIIASYVSVTMHFTMNIFKKITNIKTAKPLTFTLNILLFIIALIPTSYAVSSFLENSIYPILVIAIVFFLAISVLILANLKRSKKKGVVNESST